MTSVKRRFTDDQVERIRRVYADGTGFKQIAFFYAVNRKVIQDIVHGRTYKGAPGPLVAGPRICPHCRQVVGVPQSNTSAGSHADKT